MNIYDVYSLFDIAPVSGKGAYVYDEQGTEYLDFYGGHAVISIGHSHPHYVDRISSQLSKIGFYSNSVVNPLQEEFCDTLERVSGVSGYDLFFINSGAEANENALKLASFFNQRTKVIALNKSFHGRTSAVINVTHTGKKHQAPINHGVDVVYFDKDDIEGITDEIKKGDVSAVIIEPIQGVGGLDMISNQGLEAIDHVCKSTETILIMDEVQSGYGRSGKFFAWQHADIDPDIITMAKGMGNGFPIGGVLIKSEKIPAQKGRLGTTYGGNHLACAAGLAVLEVIETEDLINNAAQKGKILKNILATIPGVTGMKGIGLMAGVEMDAPVKDFRKQLVMDQHLFTGSSSDPHVLRLLPPLNITDKEVQLFSEKLESAVKLITA